MKWIKRIILGSLAGALMAVLCGMAYEGWSRWRTARTVLPVGAVFDVNGKRSHIHCLGTGSPTVVLESGLDLAGSMSWDNVQEDMSRTTRVCSYDRAGIMWSESRAEPRSAVRIADELHALLAVAGEEGPYVMVGHSLGGPLIRVFADRFPDEVAGLVFVDASHPEQQERLPPEVAAAGGLPSPAVIKVAATIGALRLSTPPPSGPMSDQAKVAVRAYSPQSMSGVMGEVAAMEQIFAEGRETGPYGDLPIAVMSAGPLQPPFPPGFNQDIADRMWEVWQELQGELAQLSTNGTHHRMDDASHYVHWDEPEAVVAVVAEVVGSVRESWAEPSH